MGLDIDKLSSKEFNEKLEQYIVEEKLSEVPTEIIQLMNSDIISYCLNKKVGSKEEPSARVLNNWIKSGIIKVDENDKGKIKRFDIIESIWLNIVVEMRGFGVSIENIKRTRKMLFDHFVNDFSFLKFYIVYNIIEQNQTLVIYKDGGANIFATETYLRSLIKNEIPPHLSFKLIDFIKMEFPNHAFEGEVYMENRFESIEKMKLIFFLKTGYFKSMKIKITDDDIRLIENSKMFFNNLSLLKIVTDWSFEEILISIDKSTDTIITSKK